MTDEKKVRYLSLPDPEIGTRIEWIRWKLGTGPMPGSPEWEAEKEKETKDNGR